MDMYYGILLWVAKDTSHGCLSDVAGQSWMFREFILSDSHQQIHAYQDGWCPSITVKTNPKTGSEFVITKPEIVEFSIDFFRYSDGRDGYKVGSIRAAEDFSQQDYETLTDIRERFDIAKRLERKARYERRESTSENKSNA